MAALPGAHPEASSIEQVIHQMAERLERYEQQGDHRAVFQRVYLLMTREMKRRLADGFFEDAVWMERVLAGFARYYFDAVQAFEAGAPCPPAWEVAFGAAAAREGFVLQDALLGINAHINRDLPLVLVEILQADGAWPDARVMLRRRLEHDRVNVILAELIDLVQDELAAHYARLLRLVDGAMGRRDEALFSVILAHCRTAVWLNTELLLDAADESRRAAVLDRIEQDALALARRVTGGRGWTWRLVRPLAPVTRRCRLF